jgi:hypothetical protein
MIITIYKLLDKEIVLKWVFTMSLEQRIIKQ